MRYREFGKTGEKISELSLGCMRFPDEEAAAAIVRKSVELGINYFETSCRYCDGNSEAWLGKGLQGIRDRALVSTKSTPYSDATKTSDGVRQSIEASLERLGVEYLDFYHAWMVNDPDRYRICRARGGWLEGVRKAMDEGLIRHVGVTGHAPPDVVKQIIDDDIFETITIQYSIILQGYRDVVRHAHGKGVGVVIMGPLAGGLLARQSPVLDYACAPLESVESAFRYVMCDPGVSTAASGMMSVEEVEKNVAIFDRMPETMSMDYQREISDRVNQRLEGNLDEVFCAGCRYCISVCPESLRVFDVFTPYNMTFLGAGIADIERVAENAEKMVDKCTECRACEEICPQKLRIPDLLRQVRDHLAG